MSAKSDPLLAAVDDLVRRRPPPLAEVLDAVLARFDCPLGTIHVMRDDGDLVLAAERNLPPPVRAKVEVVPIGKGMAGIAAERRAPVQVCNLQTDESGVVRPGAKLTLMEGAIACPMLAGERLVGVLGVAKPVPYEFTAAETDLLMAVGKTIAQSLAGVAG
ncbi:MAG TPA: GAF domain-containing protein [Planctomycetota bacterium]|nr:GAF domain-containing protein [Planctomycetota bacterium]